MIKVENIDTYGWEAAIRGMRNPLNSWNKSDSVTCDFWMDECCDKCGGLNEDETCNRKVPFEVVGKNDLQLMQKLFKGGTEHRKFLRMIIVTMDITAPLYWWKEFDTYKVGTVANSCSTMHTIMKKEFEESDFSCDHLGVESVAMLHNEIDYLNSQRKAWQDNDKDKFFWWQIIQLLPTSYNQRRTVQMSYENVYTILRQRSHHKLDEWIKLCEILNNLPYVKEIADYEESAELPTV